MPDLAVGSIQQSLLSEAQFQAVMGSTNWVLANGQGVSGSQYNLVTGFTNVPDFRGCFIRMTGGEAGLLGVKQDSSVDSTQLSATTEIGGTSVDVGGSTVVVSGSKNQMNSQPSSSTSYTNTIAFQKTTVKVSVQATPDTSYLISQGGSSTTYTTQNSHNHSSMNWSGSFSASGSTPAASRLTASETRAATVIAGEETRPVNIAVNYFIKIN